MSANYNYFKYRPINKRLIESLVTRTWYFARPDTLNDPFDCRIDLRKAFVRAAATALGSRSKFYDAVLAKENGNLQSMVNKLSNVGVCSFSLTPSSDLLWAHYADNHRGVCLNYEFAPLVAMNLAQLVGVDTVKYGGNVFTDWLDIAPVDAGDSASFLNALATVYLTAKSEQWAYEEEARIIRTEAGLLEVPRNILTGVCFGLRTSLDDIHLITDLVRQYTDCTVFSKMESDDSDFGYVSRSI